MKKYILTIIIAFVLILSVVQYFQIKSLKENINGGATGALDMGSWTENEKMMYEHHGTVPARFQGAATQTQQNTMVGGC